MTGGQTEREGKVRHKSIKSARGALKKKERVVRSEMERFGISLAQLETVKEADVPKVTPAAVGGDAKMEGVEEAPAASGAAGRFAALRGFIAATMEQNPAFAARKDQTKAT